MSDVADFGLVTVEMVRQTFPQWRVFEQGGTWWAIRSGLQVRNGPRSLLLCVINSADLTVLAEKLCAQDWLTRLDDEALASVYRNSLTGSAP